MQPSARLLLVPLLTLLLSLGAAPASTGAIPQAPAAVATAQEIPTGDPAEHGLSPDVLDRVAPAVQRLVDDGQIAGAVTLVLRDGHVVQQAALGMRNIAADEAMTGDTIFRIYSMSKPVVSVALLTLYDEGELELDDPLSMYLPEFEDLEVYADGGRDDMQTVPCAREPTVRDLLRHTAGFTYGVFGNHPVDQLYQDAAVLSQEHDLESFCTALGEVPLMYQPGTRWLYSVSNDVQGRLIEVISEQPLDEFLEERLFAPLDMRDTGFFVPADRLDRFAANYGWKQGDTLPVVDDPATSTYRVAPRFLSGGGGLVSTARDYARFCQMLLNGGELHGTRILEEDTVVRMSRDQLPEEVPGVSFGTAPDPGLGFGLGGSVRTRRTVGAARVGEFAWGGLASTDFWISPGDDLAVVVLSQSMPYSGRLPAVVKPLVYAALETDAE